jgi:hypothetical protein
MGRLRLRPLGAQIYRIGRASGNVAKTHTHIHIDTWRNLDKMAWQHKKYRLITGS